MAGPAEPVPALMLGPIQTSKVFDEIFELTCHFLLLILHLLMVYKHDPFLYRHTQSIFCLISDFSVQHMSIRYVGLLKLSCEITCHRRESKS